MGETSDSSIGKEILVPTAIFRNRKLNVLKALVTFLREQHRLGFSEIARLIRRDPRNVWAAYHLGIERDPDAVVPEGDSLFFPVSIVREDDLSILESVVAHLREHRGNAEIARLLSRDPRTTDTAYRRAKEKRLRRVA